MLIVDRRQILRSFVALCLLMVVAGVSYAAPMSARDVAVKEATAFLGLLDQQRYTEAWQVGDRYFQSRLSVQKWRSILKAYRIPLGRVSARRQLSVKHLDGFESAPAGIYVQVEFRSTFGRVERLERLVVHKDFDSRWRVAGYQLR